MASSLELLLGPEFATGLAWGLGAVLIALLVGLTRWKSSVAPAGELTGIAVLIALPVTSDVPLEVWLGIAALIAGGVVVRFVNAAWVPPVVAIPGAWLIATSIVGYDPGWVPWFAGGAIVLGGWAAASFSTGRATSRWSPAMYSLFAVGIFLSVPDTEAALVLLGALGPLILLSLPLTDANLSVSGALTLIGSAVWVIAAGGIGRPASIIGATACLGLLVAEPMARRLRGHGDAPMSRVSEGWSALVVWSVAQLFVVLAVSRTAGLLEGPAGAALIAAGLLASAIAAIVAGRWASRETLERKGHSDVKSLV